MVDVARLEVQADSSTVRRTDTDLNRLNRTARTTDQVTGRVNDRFANMRRMAGMAAGALGGISAALAFRGTINTIAEFEQSMAEVQAISRATDEQFKVMSETAKELGSTTEFTGAQAASGLKFLSMAGFEAQESVAAIPDVLNLATAAGIDLGQAADITSNVLSGFGKSASDASEMADVLAATSSRANTNVSQLGNAMSLVAPVAKTLDMSLQETSAAIGVLSDAGIQGQRAGTNLRGTLASLAEVTPKAEEALREAGLTVEDVNVKSLGFTQVMENLQQANINTSQAIRIFGREAASGALAIAEGSDRLREFTGELGNVEGESQRMADTMRDTLQGSFKELMSAAQGLAISIGDQGLESTLKSGVQALTALVRAIEENIDWIARLTKIIGGLIAIRLTAWLVSVATQMAINTQQAIAYQLALLKMSGGARAATASLSLMHKSLLVVQAAFISFQVGSWLHDEFDIAKKAGNKIASFMHQLAVILGGEFDVIGAKIGGAFDNPLDVARNEIVSFMEWMVNLPSRAPRGLLQMMGMDFAAENLKLDLDGLRSEAGKELNDTVEQIRADARAEAGNVADGYQELFDEIGTQIEQMSVRAQTIDRFPQMVGEGLQEMSVSAEPMEDVIDKQDRLNDLVREAGRVFDETRTPLEQFNEQMELLNTLRDTTKNGDPLISKETYQRAVEQAQDQLERLQEQGEETFFDMEEAAKQMSRNIHDALTEFFLNPFEGGLKGLADTFTQMLHRMAAEAAANEVMGMVNNAMGGGSTSDMIGNALSTVFGGSRDAGGRGEPGKAYMIGRGAQPEMFVPDQPGSFQPAGDGSMNVTMNVYTQDAGSFKRSKASIERDATTMMKNARRNS